MYCTNCGKRLNNGDVYCTSCGTKNNYQNDYNNFNKDNNYSLLLIVSILFPIAGIIFYVIYRKKYKKAKNYLIASLIAIALKIVVIFIAICLNLFLFDNFNYDIIDSIDDVDDYIDEDNEIVEFNYYLFSYVILAEEKFRSDDVSSVCYDIDDLKNSLKYDGSIEISNVSGELVIMVWFTDGKYYVDSLNFDDYKIDKIMKGNFINKTCSINNFNNSL